MTWIIVATVWFALSCVAAPAIGMLISEWQK